MNEQCELPKFGETDAGIQRIVLSARTVAIVGLSDKPERPAYRVADYLKQHGYRIIPVNPKADTVLGEKAYPDLLAVPDHVDVVIIFRRPEAVPSIVEQAIQKHVPVVWMQEGIVHNEAAARAIARGIKVVMNRCFMKEHLRATTDEQA